MDLETFKKKRYNGVENKKENDSLIDITGIRIYFGQQ